MQTLSLVGPICRPSVMLTSTDNLAHYVESPLLEACRVLLQRGIRTCDSSANMFHIVDMMPAYITLDFGRMTPANQRIAQQICRVGVNGWYARLEISLPVNLSVPALSMRAVALANQFETQTLSMKKIGNGETLGELHDWFSLMAGSDMSAVLTAEFFQEQKGFSYDPATKLFYSPEYR